MGKRGKRVETTWQRNKKGKLVKTNKTKSVETNLGKGMGAGRVNLKSDASKLKLESMREKAQTARHAQTQKTIRWTEGLATIGNAANKVIGSNSQTTSPIKVNNAIDQSVNGGLTQGSNRRDEEDDPYVD